VTAASRTVEEEVGVDERYEAMLRRLAVLDERMVEIALPMDVAGELGITVDPRTTALVRLAALVALQSSAQAFDWCVTAALMAGSSEEEVVAVLAAIAPMVGSARVGNAAAGVATAMGCRVDVPGLD
jgi:4-carboxymuconolactone decarboxylase